MPVTWKEAELKISKMEISKMEISSSVNHCSSVADEEAKQSESSSCLSTTLTPASHCAYRSAPQRNDKSCRDAASVTVCNECCKEVTYFKLRNHLAYDCPQRLLQCNLIGCNATFPACEESLHKTTCIARKRASASQSWSKVDGLNSHESCPKCSASYEESTLREHLSSTCRSRLTTCRFCQASVEQGRLLEHIDAHLSQRNALVEHRKQQLEAMVPCPACGLQVASRKLSQHQKRKCSQRLVVCPNRLQGCKVEVAAKDVSWHARYACSVTVQREEMSLRTKCRVNTTRCVQQCGELVKIRNMRFHCSSTCTGQFMQCACGATIRKSDQAEHAQRPLFYALHRVPACMVARRRDEKAERFRMRQQNASE